MKFRPLLAVLLALLLWPAGARADLADEIRAVLRDKYFNKADVGVAILRLGDRPEAVFRHESDIPLIPASNLKLLTTSAALDVLGPDFKFRTLLIGNGQDLCLVGDGDPTLGDYELLKKSGWGVTTVFARWADELKRRGITSVGNVLVDDSIFDEQFLPPNWSPRYSSARYSAQVGGLNLNANCVDFYLQRNGAGQVVRYSTDPPTRYVSVRNTCVSGSRHAVVLARNPGKNEIILSGEVNADSTEPVSVTVHDPPMFAGSVLAETLAAGGVSVSGDVMRDRTVRSALASGQSWKVIAALETPLVPEVLARANKDSMNLYAEALCKRLGNASTAQPGSWGNGTAAVGAFLERIGIAPSQFSLDDGSGLSRKNTVSAGAIAQLLAWNFASKNAEIFRASLGVAGADGTMEKRFRNTDLQGRVLAKSGYIDGVSALSGYLHARDGRWYAFSILMNNLPEKTNNTAKEMQERIVKAVDRGT